jgi:hypothetical protein
MSDERPPKGRRDKDFLNKMTTKERQQWAKQIVHRMMKAWQISDKKAIADVLGCHPKIPGNWIQNGNVPWHVIYTCHLDTGVSLDWLYNAKLPTTEITPEMHEQLLKMAEEVLSLGVRMNLVKEANANGFEALSQSMVADLLKKFTAFTPPE